MVNALQSPPIAPVSSATGGLSVDIRWLAYQLKGWEGLSEAQVEEKIYELQRGMLDHPGFDPNKSPPLIHHHAPDIYMREIRMPAGDFVIGAKHKTDHFNIILTGSALVLMEGKLSRVSAPQILRSGAGVKKVLVIIEDMTWVTVHANLDQETDPDVLEDRLTIEPPHRIYEELETRRTLRALDLKLRGSK
jgi:hypothetical protein